MLDLNALASERENLMGFAKKLEQHPDRLGHALRFLVNHFNPKVLEPATTTFVSNEIIELCDNSIDSIGDDVSFKDVKLGSTEIIFLEKPIEIIGGYTKIVNFIFVSVNPSNQEITFMTFQDAGGVNGCFTAYPDNKIGDIASGTYISDTSRPTLGKETSTKNYIKVIKYYLAICSWRSSKIVVNDIQEVSRSFRKRAGNQDTRVRIIKLRQKETFNKSFGNSNRSYSCRWIVRGFFRRQWYPRTQEHKLIFVDSFVKGPKDAEFKVTEQIRLVTR